MSLPDPSTLPAPPTISKSIRTIAGLLVDVYGLEELSPTTTHLSCLWLHHPRTRSKELMADIAARCVGAWNARPESKRRGLVALAFDQRNHGTRLVHEAANGAWREGNETHAQDMVSGIVGMTSDQAVMIDVVEGYLVSGDKQKVDQHLALGISLGGHTVWQVMFADPRIRAGVSVVGCPDLTYLLSDRAKKSKLPTFSAHDSGASFLGSKDFPPSLVQTCQKYDPKAILFGTANVPEVVDQAVKQALSDRLRRKKLLLCSGGADKLVPYACSEPFTRWLKGAAEQLKEEGIVIDDRVYPGVGHEFCVDMINDAVEFVTDVVLGADQDMGVKRASPKI